MITKQNYGAHADVLIAEFGHGDITFAKATYPDDQHATHLLFMNHEKRKIGEVSNEWEGKTSDEVPRPDVVFVFKNPESITALIHSLAELQKEVFEHCK